MRRTGRIALAAIALGAAALIADLAWGPHARLGPGHRLPDIAFATPEGPPAHLSAYAGQVVLLEFFATW